MSDYYPTPGGTPGNEPTHGHDQPQGWGQPPGGQPAPPMYGAYPPGAPGGYGMPWPMKPPAHPSSGLAMGLGITSLVGAVLCGFLLVCAPFAWVIGGRTVREVDAEPGRWSGREAANAGRIMGVVGTVLLVLGLLALGALIAVLIASPDSFGS